MLIKLLSVDWFAHSPKIVWLHLMRRKTIWFFPIWFADHWSEPIKEKLGILDNNKKLLNWKNSFSQQIIKNVFKPWFSLYSHCGGIFSPNSYFVTFHGVSITLLVPSYLLGMSQLCADNETVTKAALGANDVLQKEKAAAEQVCHPELGGLMSLMRVWSQPPELGASGKGSESRSKTSSQGCRENTTQGVGKKHSSVEREAIFGSSRVLWEFSGSAGETTPLLWLETDFLI